jgi:hypothetical protein
MAGSAAYSQQPINALTADISGGFFVNRGTKMIACCYSTVDILLRPEATLDLHCIQINLMKNRCGYHDELIRDHAKTNITVYSE